MYPEEVRNFISGNYSAADRRFVKNWIKEDPAREEKLKELKKVWDFTEDLELTSEDKLDQAWSDLNSKMKEGHADNVYQLPTYDRSTQSKSKDGWNIFLKVAAVLVIAAGFYALYVSSGSQPQEEVTSQLTYKSTIRAEYGEQVRFRMRDGTVVTLNSGSKIRHDNQYGKGNRELYLSGEAYFEVNNEGQQHPFVVNTDNARIEDLSTGFNINAYDENEETEIVVSDGEVEVSSRAQESQKQESIVRVEEGRMVNVSKSEHSLVVKKADLDQALGWLDRRLIFDNEPFENIVKRLERYYNIEITVHDDSLKEKIVKASFEDERVNKVMSVLAISLGAEYEIEGKQVSFGKKQLEN